MRKSVNSDVCIIGSDMVVGVYFPPVDGEHTFTSLLENNNITVQYYVMNTVRRYTADRLYQPLSNTDPDYDNLYAFNINTSDMKEGVLMVEVRAEIPDSRFGEQHTRTEIARCSSGIALIK